MIHACVQLPSKAIWIFQANPQKYDLTGALDKLKQQTWLVTSYRNEIREGNTVYLWEPGAKLALSDQPQSLENQWRGSSSQMNYRSSRSL